MSVIKIDLSQKIKSQNEYEAVLVLIPLVDAGNVRDGLIDMARNYIPFNFLTGEEQAAYEHSLDDAINGIVKTGRRIRLSCVDATGTYERWETHPWE